MLFVLYRGYIENEMQFLTYPNSPQAYEYLYRSNLLKSNVQPDDVIFTPGVGDDGYSAGYRTHWNTKDKSDVFNFGDYLLDNHYNPIYYNGLIDYNSFLGNRYDNPYKTGEAQTFFFENGGKPPYSNNYGWMSSVGNWDPYIHPRKRLQNYIENKVIRDADRQKMIYGKGHRNALCYPLLADDIDREKKRLYTDEYLVQNGNELPLNQNLEYDLKRNGVIENYDNNITPHTINSAKRIGTVPHTVNTPLKSTSLASNTISGNNTMSTNSMPNTMLGNIDNKILSDTNPIMSTNYVNDTVNANDMINVNNEDLLSMSIDTLSNKTALVAMDIIGDISKWVENPNKTVGDLFKIIGRPDRMPYVGILLIIIALIWMILL